MTCLEKDWLIDQPKKDDARIWPSMSSTWMVAPGLLFVVAIGCYGRLLIRIPKMLGDFGMAWHLTFRQCGHRLWCEPMHPGAQRGVACSAACWAEEFPGADGGAIQRPGV